MEAPSENLQVVQVASVRHSLRESHAPKRIKRTWAPISPVKTWEILLVILIALAAAALNWEWIITDKGPLFEHSGRFIRNSVVTWMRLTEGQGIKPDPYPPCAYLVSALCYQIFGLSRVAAMGSQLIFYFPYVFACWYLGRRIGDYGGGVLVALAAAGNLWFALHVHGYFLEISLTALVACAWAWLVASDGCKRRWPTLALGVTIGLGMLCKWVFLLFVGPALLWPLWLAWREGKASRWLALAGIVGILATMGSGYAALGLEFWSLPRSYYFVSLNSLLAALAVAVIYVVRRGWKAGAGFTIAVSLGGLISSWWYFLSIQELEIKAAGDFAQQNSSATAVHFLNQALVSCYWMVPLLFVAGLAYGFMQPKLRWYMALALSGIAPAFAFYAYSNVPIGARYLLPSTVCVLVVAFAWIGRCGRIWKWVAPVLVCVSCLQLMGHMLPHHVILDEITETLRIDAPNSPRLKVLPPPDTEVPPVGNLTRYMLSQLDLTGESRFTAAIMPDSRLDVDMLLLDALLQGRLIDIEHYLPGRTRAVPKTSMLLVIEGKTPIDLASEGDWAKEYEKQKVWLEPRWGVWTLYKHPTKIDMRPLPGITSGPPRNPATVE